MIQTSQAVHQLALLHHKAASKGHRAFVKLAGPVEWQRRVVESYRASIEDTHNITAVSLGWSALNGYQLLTFKQGRKLLGTECHLLAVDLSQSFDANGFNAACGSLIGGGLLILTVSRKTGNPSEEWLDKALSTVETIDYHTNSLPIADINYATGSFREYSCDTSEQANIIPAVERVLKGHRKRPLVLTADRGRGKSSGLGIAVATMMKNEPCRVVVTAPNKAAVASLFRFAAQTLGCNHSSRLEYNGGWLRFVSPDELLDNRPDADIVIVDEAAALPLPMLYGLIEHYHRMVFSSTIHGYEGCGRGFTLKFMDWLDEHRKGWKKLHLSQPMRWAPQDSLEEWLSDTFLLSVEADNVERIDSNELTISKLEIKQLLSTPQLLESCIGLLINAHYQTSPNDIFTLLDDEKISLYAALRDTIIVGVVLCVEEGGLDKALIEDIQTGRRRPSGHLVAANLANHLAEERALTLASLRIMRIAVHPKHQGKGIGRLMLGEVITQRSTSNGYVSTSFGVTTELIDFWQKAKFDFVKLGVSKDHSSGTYSGIWVYRAQQQEWLNAALSLSQKQLITSIGYECQSLDSKLGLTLLSRWASNPICPEAIKVLRLFSKGGNSIASARASVVSAVGSDAQSLLNVKDCNIVIDVVLKNRPMADLVTLYCLSSGKQIELLLRTVIGEWIDLHCKLFTCDE